MLFVKKGECPNFFMKKCNVLHGKLASFEMQIFSKKVYIFITNGCFIDKITKLHGVGSPSDEFCPKDKKCQRCLLIKKRQNRVSEISAMEDFGNSMFRNVSTVFNGCFGETLQEIHILLHNFSIFHNSRYTVFLQEFMIRCLLCTKLRIGNALIHHINANKNGRLNMIENLLFKANVPKNNLCPSEISQIAHVFFSQTNFINMF